MLADENGRVAYPNLPKGRYIVNCEAPEYLIAESNWIELEDNQEEDVTVVLERAAIVRFEVSDELRKNYGHETLYVVCNVRNLDIGEKVNPSSMYGLSDEHIVWLCSEKLPKDHQSVIKIPEGSYAIEYRLYSDKQGILSYRMKSPMSEKTVETHLVKTQEFIIDISQ
jgi:hypothetical protein